MRQRKKDTKYKNTKIQKYKFKYTNKYKYNAKKWQHVLYIPSWSQPFALYLQWRQLWQTFAESSAIHFSFWKEKKQQKIIINLSTWSDWLKYLIAFSAYIRPLSTSPSAKHFFSLAWIWCDISLAHLSTFLDFRIILWSLLTKQERLLASSLCWSFSAFLLIFSNCFDVNFSWKSTWVGGRCDFLFVWIVKRSPRPCLARSQTSWSTSPSSLKCYVCFTLSR